MYVFERIADRKRALFCAASLSILLFGLYPASGAIRTAADRPSAGASCNPVPSHGDIELPMPAGLTMVFRPVAVESAKGILYDFGFDSGMPAPEDGRSVFEHRMRSHVAGFFTCADLPQNWIRALDPPQDQGYFYYFMAKYEVTGAQWHSVMGGTPAEGEKPNAPKAGISYYDIQEFLRKYNAWLMKNHPEALPVIEKSIPGWLRLPTEQEWEYAALGGIRKAPESLVDDAAIAHTAVFGSKYREPNPIGTQKANALGLHDMCGNVAELTCSPFRFIVADADDSGNPVYRYHGSGGGMVVKGGSFRAVAAHEVHPGRRDEMRMFRKSASAGGKRTAQWEPSADRAVGFRPVLAGTAAQGTARLAEVGRESGLEQPAAEYGAGGSKKRTAAEKDLRHQERPELLLAFQPNYDPVEAVDRVIASAGNQPVLQNNLLQLRDLLKGQQDAKRRESSIELENSIRSVLYQAEGIRNIAYRCNLATVALKGEKTYNKDLNLSSMRKSFNELFDVLRTSGRYYADNVLKLSRRPAAEVAAKISHIRGQYGGDDLLNRHMRANIDGLVQHLGICRSKQGESFAAANAWEKLVTPEQLKNISSVRSRIGK